jgi:N-acetylmuramoyl-L-alanine amidase
MRNFLHFVRVCSSLVFRCFPSVGLIVLLGSFNLVLVPEPEKSAENPRNNSALPTVVIDPGHGGIDDGCVGSGLREKDLTLDLAARLSQVLQNYNFPTVMTRETDSHVSLPDRSAMANAFPHALFVSIHCNQSRDPNVMGGETFYADQKNPPLHPWSWLGFFDTGKSAEADNGESLASFIQTSMIMRLNVMNRGIKGRNLYVVRNVQSPAVLVEPGFLSNAFEAQLLANADYRKRIAAAIAEGIISYERTRLHRTPQPRLAELSF